MQFDDYPGRRRWFRPADFFILVLAATIFEGAARKWLFPDVAGIRYLLYFLKDITFAVAAFYGARVWRSRSVPMPVHYILLSAVLLVPSIPATFANSNLVGILLSFRAIVFWPLFAVLAAALIHSFHDVRRIAVAAAVMTILVAALGAVQYNLPKGHPINRYDSGAEEVNVVERFGHVRAVGPFSYIGGMAMMPGFGAWAALILLFSSPRKLAPQSILGAATLFASLFCGIVAMSRSAAVFWLVTVLGSLLLSFRRDARAAFVLGLVFVCGLVIIFAEIEATPASSDSYAYGFTQRLENSDTFTDRLSFVLNNLSRGAFGEPFGNGLGLGQPGGAYAATGGRGSDGSKYFESEWGRIAYEVGILGLIGVLSVRFYIVRCIYGFVSIAAEHRSLSVYSATLPYFAIISLGWMVFNHIGNALAWVTASVAIGLAYSRCLWGGDDT